MKVKYDSEVDALNIQFEGGEYEVSEEVSEGIILDYSVDGRIMSIEILDASGKISLKDIKDLSADRTV